MTQQEYRAALRTLGWSAREFARQVGRSPDTAGNWYRREVGYDVPTPQADWLRRAAAAHAAWKRDNPPPE